MPLNFSRFHPSKSQLLDILMRKVILVTVVLITSVVANAQRLVSGKVVEQDTQEAVIQATASILSGEKVVANALTNMNGGFSIRAPHDGRYTLKITYVGFKTYHPGARCHHAEGRHGDGKSLKGYAEGRHLYV